ncbi:MAG: ATP-binding protein [Bacteroidaceae bacterium]|nr:ATP-binding protein [Bacteroidaceae bacterium]
MLQPLLPVKLNKDDASYQTVEELAEVLRHAIDNGDIRNVALTGPYGSGKSSIIQTLMGEYGESEGFHYLPISLATLQADEEEGDNDNDNKKDKQDEKWTETLNRKIEYSILQQLIYREKAKTVPNSRFRRIVHIEHFELIQYALGCLGFLLAFLIVFEPSYAKVDTIYGFLNFGKWNIIFDIISSLYLLYALYKLCTYFIKSYANSKLNKLNLKDGDIEMKEENSIFNKHLDEILYFFQVTQYNVVVIEDLDRFETEKIYLKLRELCQLVNESKIVGRHIVFLYAIKDDVFVDEARTKFFDYISTVIPVINPSNSKAKLKEALKDRGFNDNEIPDEDLSEIAFFIQDMRILTNIANEYSQYRCKLYNPDKNYLSRTKLLAMIVYKNYFPKDFSQLHKRDGLVYSCLVSKNKFIDEAQETLDVKKVKLEEKKKLVDENNHLKETDLRYLFLLELRESVNGFMQTITINNQDYTLKQIAQNRNLFNGLYNLTSINYQYNAPFYGRQNQSAQINVNAINNKMQYESRLAAIKTTQKDLQKEEKELKKEELKIQSLKLNVLIKKYNLGNTELYRNMHLSPLMDVFIRRGYIDEDYYDYISYFYPGMVSLADRDLLLSMKREIKQAYTYHIDKIENFVKELKDYMFESDAILNNDLLDYAARKKASSLFLQIMRRTEKDDAPLDFLAQYYQLGKRQKEVFTEFVNWNNELSWQMISNHTNNDEQQVLREAWLKYADNTTSEQETWLSSNYAFLANRVDVIGMEQCKKLSDGCMFTDLNNDNNNLLDYVVEQWRYVINVGNLCLIINHLRSESVASPENLNLTRITETSNDEFENYVKDDFSEAFGCFSLTTKDESVESIIYILNSEDVVADKKITYLIGQKELISSFDGINETFWEIAIKSFVIQPTWNNVDVYYSNKGSLTDDLIKFIEHYHCHLEEKCQDDIASKQILFEGLLCSNVLNIESFRSICLAFDLQFDNNKSLGSVERERLEILLENEKIAFTKANTSILMNTNIYSEYLVHYSQEFIDNLDESYQLDEDTVFTLFYSNRFTIQEKRRIIDVTNEDILLSSSLADKVIELLLDSNDISLDGHILIGLLQSSTNLHNKLLLVCQMLKVNQYSMEDISSLLATLGGKYVEIAERKKRPLIDKNEENVALLNQLQRLHFISTTSQEDDGIRVNPTRKQNS